MRGWIALDPTMNWAVRKYEIEVRYPRKCRRLSSSSAGRYKRQQTSVVPLEMGCTSTASNKEVTLESNRKLGILEI